jgi:hypothetical protein
MNVENGGPAEGCTALFLKERRCGEGKSPHGWEAENASLTGDRSEGRGKAAFPR